MATSTTTEFNTSFRFIVNVDDLSKSNVDSCKIDLSEVKWKVQIRESTGSLNPDTRMVSVYLVSKFDGLLDKTCDAQAVFKLWHKDGRSKKSLLKRLAKKTFDNENSSHGVEDFIEWNDFLENHVIDKRATFEIEISTNPLKRKRSASECIARTSANFQVSINKANSLGQCFSQAVYLQGTEWKILCQKADEFLQIFVYGTESDMDENWSYMVTATFNLVSFDYTVEPITQTFTREMDISRISLGYNEFLEWSEFVDEKNKFILKDEAKLIVELKVDDPFPKWKLPRITISNGDNSLQCNLCTEGFRSGEIVSINCGHVYCEPCILTAFIVQKECPKCRAAATSAQIRPIFF